MSSNSNGLTRRVKELGVALAFMCYAVFTLHYPLDPKTGWWLGEGIFLAVFGLTYLREERRAMHSPYTNVVLWWNRVEEVLFTLSVAAFYLCAVFLHLDWGYLYAFLNTYVIALLSGLLVGELVWRQLRLSQIDEIKRNRYWASYNDSIIPADNRPRNLV